MKSLSIHAMALACLAIIAMAALPSFSFSQDRQGPPVSQPLVSEGAFAIQLVGALKLGSVEDEAQAETILKSVGVAPRKGWASDEPVTPQIIGEVRDSLLIALGSRSLSMDRDEALNAFSDVTARNGLDILPRYGQDRSGGPPDYEVPDDLNSYYDQQGPPPITYYPPPYDYSGLYSWYPYPFYSYGSYFPGYYMMDNFGFFGGNGFGNGFNDHFHGRVFNNHNDHFNHFHGSNGHVDHHFQGSNNGLRIFSIRRAGSFNNFNGGFNHNNFNSFNGGFNHNNFNSINRGFSGSRIWSNQSPTQNRIWSPNGGSGFNHGFGGNSFNHGGFIHGGSMGFRGGSSMGGGFHGGGMHGGGFGGGHGGGGGGHR